MRKGLPPREAGDRRGVAAVEFALVGPLFLFIVVGMVVHGGWLWMAHSVQAAVSEGARAAVAGLDGAERERLARDMVAVQLNDLGLKSSDAVVQIRNDNGVLRVEAAYDISRHPLMALAPLTVAPSPVIRRTAAVQVGQG